MATSTKNVTIQQHQPLRTPAGWGRQEKAFIVQLDEILDDIYKRFGRLKLSDMSEQLQQGITVIDLSTGERKYVSETVTDINDRVEVAEQAATEAVTATSDIEERLNELGYGSVYMQPNEPDHAGLVVGDIWIQTLPNATWQTVKNDFASWEYIRSSFSSWQVVGGKPKMFVWDGNGWVQIYDSLVETSVWTEIEQLEDMIALRATQQDLDILSGEVTTYASQITIMSQEIESTVIAVNEKPTVYVQQDDPRNNNTVKLGDVWVRHDEYLESWSTLASHYASWQSFKNTHSAWLEGLGDQTYVWNGVAWIETSDMATQIINQTKIDQTSTQIQLMATQQANFQGELVSLASSLTITAAEIRGEVAYAVSGCIAKTTAYQTATDIVTAAETYVDGILTDESAIAQSATGIVAYVANRYYGLVSGVAIVSAGVEISGSKYVKIKSGGSFLVDSGNFAIDTSGNVTVKGAVISTSGSIGGWTLASNSLSSGSGSGYVAMSSNPSGTYAIWAGNSSAGSAPFRVTRAGILTATGATISGTLTSTSGTIGGWTLANKLLSSGSGSGYVALDSNTSDTYAIWAGNATAGSAPFRVSRAGALTSTSGSIGGWTLAANLLSSGSGSGYVALDSNASDTYAIWAGNATAGSAPFRVTRAGALTATNATITGTITSTNGTIGGWTLASSNLHAGSSSSYVALASSGTYAFWAGGENASSAPCRIKFNGEAAFTKLLIVGENNTETDINLRTYGLWKLNYNVIKSITTSGGYATAMTLSNGDTVNFNSASAVTMSGSWSNARYSVIAYDGAGAVVGTEQSQAVGYSNTSAQVKSALESSSSHYTAVDILAGGSSLGVPFLEIDASGVYQQGITYADSLYSYLGRRELGYMDHGEFVSVGSHTWYYKN